MPRVIDGMFTAGIKRRGRQLQNHTFTARSARQKMGRLYELLPQAWQRAAINFDRFEALREANAEGVEAQIARMIEGKVYMPFELDGKLQLLNVAEIEALEGKSLDEAAVVAQLTP